jgi:type 1 glutamine amidotransferase
LVSLSGLLLPGACTLEDPEISPSGGGSSTAGSGGSSQGTNPLGGDSGEPGGATPGTSGSSNVSGGSGGVAGSTSPTAGTASDAGANQGGGGDGASGSEQGGGAGAGGDSSEPDPYSGPFKILVLEKTLGFRHDSIPFCESLLTDLGKTTDGAMPPGTKPGSQFTVTIANDNLSEFTDAGLASYALVFFCSPTGNVFSEGPNGAVGMAALQKFVEGGGAWAGVHAALDFEKTGGFPWFTNTLTGAYMASHEPDGTGWNVTVPGAFTGHPVVSGVPNPWSAADEWYTLSRDIETLPGFKVVQKLPDNRPATWVKDVSNGRMFYTERGHNKTVYAEVAFKRLLLNGVLWATRRLN